jgi:hypothetical protein
MAIAEKRAGFIGQLVLVSVFSLCNLLLFLPSRLILTKVILDALQPTP